MERHHHDEPGRYHISESAWGNLEHDARHYRYIGSQVENLYESDAKRFRGGGSRGESYEYSGAGASPRGYAFPMGGYPIAAGERSGGMSGGGVYAFERPNVHGSGGPRKQGYVVMHNIGGTGSGGMNRGDTGGGGMNRGGIVSMNGGGMDGGGMTGGGLSRESRGAHGYAPLPLKDPSAPNGLPDLPTYRAKRVNSEPSRHGADGGMGGGGMNGGDVGERDTVGQPHSQPGPPPSGECPPLGASSMSPASSISPSASSSGRSPVGAMRPGNNGGMGGGVGNGAKRGRSPHGGGAFLGSSGQNRSGYRPPSWGFGGSAYAPIDADPRVVSWFSAQGFEAGGALFGQKPLFSPVFHRHVSAMAHAAYLGDVFILEFLLDQTNGRTNARKRDAKGVTPVIFAAMAGKLGALALLCSPKGGNCLDDLSKADVHGQTPLHWAAALGHLATVDWILRTLGFANSSRSAKPLLLDVNGHLAQAHRGLDKRDAAAAASSAPKLPGAPVGRGGGGGGRASCLAQAAVQLLKAKSKADNTALFYACANGHLEVAMVLLAYGAALGPSPSGSSSSSLALTTSGPGHPPQAHSSSRFPTTRVLDSKVPAPRCGPAEHLAS